jgi:hypothetical protein
MDVGLGAKPGDLAFGVLPGFVLTLADSIGKRQTPTDNIDGLFVAQSLKAFGARGNPRPEKRPGFLNQAKPEHRGGSLVEPIIKDATFGIEADLEYPKACQRLAGRVLGWGELDGAHEFLMIVWMDAMGGGGIAAPKEAV